MSTLFTPKKNPYRKLDDTKPWYADNRASESIETNLYNTHVELHLFYLLVAIRIKDFIYAEFYSVVWSIISN